MAFVKRSQRAEDQVQNRESNSLIGFEQLAVGYEFPSTSYQLSPQLISKYTEAVGAQSEEKSPVAGFVPPLAIAAYIMTAMTKTVSLPPGTIHASQELEFLKPVPIGTTISCTSKVAQKVQRGKLNLLMIQLEALDQDKGKVLSGKATLVLPAL
ncbi:MAG: MaoC family dehydratase [Chloroflexi bacterium]|nr:MaoC family dehydratase [Chloroflexota bacterium]